MSEAALLRRVEEWLNQYPESFWYYKTTGSILGKRGSPDLLISAGGIFIGLELKRGGEKPTKLQEKHLAAITKTGGIGMWSDNFDEIRARLEEILHG